jgi:intracellular septation protein
MNDRSKAAAGPPSTSHGFDGFQMAVDYAGLAAMLVTWIITHFILHLPQAFTFSTFALVAGAAVGLTASVVVRKKLAPLPAFYGGAALVFGTLTLVFHDPTIVKMKTTVIDTALGLLMLGGLALRRNPLGLVTSGMMHLSEKASRQLTLRFGLFFLFLAATNEFVWRTQPDSTWVFFRVFGLMGLTLVFAGFQVPLLMKEAHLAEPQDRPEAGSEPEA